MCATMIYTLQLWKTFVLSPIWLLMTSSETPKLGFSCNLCRKTPAGFKQPMF